VNAVLGNMRTSLAGLRLWTTRVLASPWWALPSALAVYQCVGAGLRYRPRGSLGPFEWLSLPAPAMVVAMLVMAVLIGRKAPVAEHRSFQRWLRFIGLWLTFTALSGGDTWYRYAPNTRSRPSIPPLVSPKEFLDSYMGVWRDLAK
jgi:hypothetical protein